LLADRPAAAQAIPVGNLIDPPRKVAMNTFDVRIYAIRRGPDRRRPFEVRWHAAARAWYRSFTTRALADGYRAELVRAARTGLESDCRGGDRRHTVRGRRGDRWAQARSPCAVAARPLR
jgi:hypothetical protein